MFKNESVGQNNKNQGLALLDYVQHSIIGSKYHSCFIFLIPLTYLSILDPRFWLVGSLKLYLLLHDAKNSHDCLIYIIRDFPSQN